MGNKLDATRIALDKGFTGVSDPTATLSSITKGMQDVASWKKGIDDAEIKLKQDTAKAYQDARTVASERMTGNKTVDAAILKSLESTKERLYDNMKMVQKGMIDPTDNIIFRENASKSYDILSSYLQDYEANFAQSIKELKGYVDEKTGEFVKPTAGAYQAALQRFQTTLGDPNLYEILSSEDGSLNMNLYKTKINKKLNTRELVLDEEGKPIIDPSMSGIGASTLLKNKNQKAARVYMYDDINAALAEGTALNKSFQTLKTMPGYTGVIVDDVRNNPDFGRVVDAAVSSGTATPEQRISILMDNMPDNQAQIPVMPNEVEDYKAQGVDLNEKVEYTYTDEDGIEKTGTYNKYVISELDPMSKLFLPVETEEATLASERIYKSAIISGLQRKIVGRDRRPVVRPTQTSGGNDEKLNTFMLIDQVVGEGNRDSLESIVREDPNIRSFKIIPKTGDSVESIVFVKADGTETAPIPVGGNRGAVDVGKLLSSELGYGAEEYANNSKYTQDTVLSSKVSSFEGFRKPGKEYAGLGALMVGLDGKNPVYATETLKSDHEENMASKAQVIVDRARKTYDNIPDILVGSEDNWGTSDTISMTVDGVKYSNTGSESENYNWLIENLDKALSGKISRRTVAQIMKEDGVNVSEATKIFNAQ